MRAAFSPGQRDQALLFGVMLVLAIGNTGLQSVLPAIGRSLAIPDPLIALAFSFSALAWSIAAPFWAKRLNRSGSKAMVIIGLGGFIVSLLFCGIALSAGILGVVSAGLAFAGFVVGRAIYGCLGAAAPSAAQAIVAARTSRADRTKALTLLASAFGLGTILGPALAPFFVLPVIGLAGPPYIFASLGAVVLMVVIHRLADVPGGVSSRGAPAAEPLIGTEPSGASVLAATAKPTDRTVRFTDPRIWPWMLVGLVAGHAQAIAGQTMAFLIIDRLAIPPSAVQPLIGMVLMSGAGSALLAQWGVIPRLDVTPRQLVIWGAGIAAIGTLGIAFADTLHGIAVAFAIASLGFGLLRPGFTAGASLAVTEDEQGVVAGRVTANNGFVFLFGPSAGILMYGLWRPLPYIACAAGLAGLLLYSFRKLSDAEETIGDIERRRLRP